MKARGARRSFDKNETPAEKAGVVVFGGLISRMTGATEEQLLNDAIDTLEDGLQQMCGREEEGEVRRAMAAELLIRVRRLRFAGTADDFHAAAAATLDIVAAIAGLPRRP